MDYGYPGNASYRHERPFDYFRFESSVSAEGIEHLSTRGLIAGADYGADASAASGASTASTTTSRRMSFASPARRSRRHHIPDMDIRVAGGAEFRARRRRVHCGAIARATADRTARDYHYGVAPQALANLRFIAGRRAALDVTARQYFVSGIGGFGTGRRDLIFLGDASLAFRIYQRHAIASPISLPAAARTFGVAESTRSPARRSASSTRSSARAASARCASHISLAPAFTRAIRRISFGVRLSDRHLDPLRRSVWWDEWRTSRASTMKITSSAILVA